MTRIKLLDLTQKSLFEKKQETDIVFLEELKFREWKLLCLANTLGQLMKQDEKEKEK